MKKGMCFVLVLMLLMCSVLMSTFTGFAMNEAGEQDSMDAQSTKSAPDDKTADVFEEGSEPEPEKLTANDRQGTSTGSETETREADDGRTVSGPEPEKLTANVALEAKSDIYDPQPTKKAEVRQWIDVYTATLREQGLTAALEVKPHWQYEVAERLMPDGFHCELVDDDDDYGMDYFTFMEDELPENETRTPHTEPPVTEDKGDDVQAEEGPEPPVVESGNSDQAPDAGGESVPNVTEGTDYDVPPGAGEETVSPSVESGSNDQATDTVEGSGTPAAEGEEESVEEEAVIGSNADEQTAIDTEGSTYAPQPATMEEVWEWIDLFNTTLSENGLKAALAVKPHWQYEVVPELMPEGYHCELVEGDEDFGVAFYTFMQSELAEDHTEGPVYDPQPQTMEEVQAVIDAYEHEYLAVLRAQGSLAALEVRKPYWQYEVAAKLMPEGYHAALEVRKPHWQYEVAAELMPEGYHCELVEDDEDFGAAFYTFMEGELAEEEEEDTENPVYDPQPQTMEEVQAAIDAYEQEYLAVLEAQGFLAVLEVRKPHWQYEVAAELMPEGYHCELVEDDEDFGAAFYTFMEGELAEEGEEDTEGPVYDPQPQTMEEVQAAIDAYEREYLAVLEAQGFLAALEVRKPHWQYEVPEELMPAGYRCELVDYDEDFGADYYTFFPTPVPMAFGSSGYKVEPPEGPEITGLFTLIGQAVRDPDYNNVARITEDAGDKQGIMWSKTTLDLNFPFSTKMKLYLGHKDPAPNRNAPADGVTFTMHNDGRGDEAIGGFGEGLGVYRGRSAGDFSAGRHIENALVIELDTYRNDGSGNGTVVDPNIGPHCALLIPKRGSTAADDKITLNDHKNTFPFTVEHDWVLFEVSWTPELSGGTVGGTLAYSFGGTGRTYEIDDVEDIFDGTTVWWGFSGSTGGQTALQAAAITKLPFPQPDPSEPFDFSFVKVDAQDDTICLEDAEFTLYACANDSAGHIHDELAAVGSCWFAGEAYHAASGEDGTVSFEDLDKGEYRLVETAAPATYQRPTGQWQVVVDILEDEILVTGVGNPKPPDFIKTGTGLSAQFQAANVKRYTLPMTGGRGTRGFTALGSLLLMIGAAWLYCQLRQEPRRSGSATRDERR